MNSEYNDFWTVKEKKKEILGKKVAIFCVWLFGLVAMFQLNG